MLSPDHNAYLDPEGPLRVYRDFLSAVERHDFDGALASMSADYARVLRAMRDDAGFATLFPRWCDAYPTRVDLVSCVVCSDNAIVELRGNVYGAVVAGHAVLDRIESRWCVSAETLGENARPTNPINQPIALQSPMTSARINAPSSSRGNHYVR